MSNTTPPSDTDFIWVGDREELADDRLQKWVKRAFEQTAQPKSVEQVEREAAELYEEYLLPFDQGEYLQSAREYAQQESGFRRIGSIDPDIAAAAAEIERRRQRRKSSRRD